MFLNFHANIALTQSDVLFPVSKCFLALAQLLVGVALVPTGDSKGRINLKRSMAVFSCTAVPAEIGIGMASVDLGAGVGWIGSTSLAKAPDSTLVLVEVLMRDAALVERVGLILLRPATGVAEFGADADLKSQVSSLIAICGEASKGRRRQRQEHQRCKNI